MPRKLSFFKTRRYSGSSTLASSDASLDMSSDAFDNQDCLSCNLEDDLSTEMCSSNNNSANEKSAITKDRHTDGEVSGPDGTILELQEFRETQIQQEKCLQTLRANYHRDFAMITQALEEEKSSKDVLTKGLADIAELYKNETQNLKEELTSTKEMTKHLVLKATTDIHEVLGALQYRLEQLEEQQRQKQKPLPIILEKVQNGPLIIWSVLLVLLSILGYLVMTLRP
ncbi:transmembrane and coiled-coil domains protein 1-like [Poecilia latipinna]|uniref:transmembrane and coiled-coil domains protein 1-like n=1 Tax=Poecilia latipinna TaxID=48699 RepID=UPI00072DAEF7|nr:PREDICTED: transmembrane and coiled-coil domains protein 1-like [Poecilia latipinna]